jgi:hypothetical protein
VQTYKTYLKIPFVLVVARSTSKGIFVFKITMEKKCSKCKEVKSLDEFYNDKRNKDGKQARCRNCIIEDKRKYREENREKVIKLERKYSKKRKINKNKNISTLAFIKLFEKNHGLFKCTKCGEVKSLDEFGNSKKAKNGKASSCKCCDNMYYQNNLQRIKIYRKKYHIKNKEELCKKVKKWAEKNQEKVSLYRKNYMKENAEKLYAHYRIRRETDPIFNLSCKIRSLISVTIRNQGYKKNTKTYNILKCEFNFFMEFLNGIASNGYKYGIGDLHLDHVIPISLAETEDECILLNHYSNFQLLSAFDNISKGNRTVNPINLKRVLEHHPNPDKIREIHARL